MRSVPSSCRLSVFTSLSWNRANFRPPFSVVEKDEEEEEEEEVEYAMLLLHLHLYLYL